MMEDEEDQEVDEEEEWGRVLDVGQVAHTPRPCGTPGREKRRERHE